MGFLGLGQPIPWKDSREVIEYVRKHGIAQFIAMYNKVKGIENDELLWGDELEYGIFTVDEEAGTVKLSLRSAEILKLLQERRRLGRRLGRLQQPLSSFGIHCSACRGTIRL